VIRRALLIVFASLLVRPEPERARPSDALAALLAVAHEAGASDDDAWSRAEIQRIAALVRAASNERPNEPPALVMNDTVFGQLGFVREVDDPDLRFVLLPSVLRARRGSCVGLGSLYLALAEALGWRAAGAIVPGHFFVRLGEAGRARNVELLRKGEEMPDDWYRHRFPAPGSGSSSYMRPLSLAEVLGVIEYDIGDDRRRARRLFEARSAYQRATRDFPTFAEAHASLGQTQHLLGALDAAELSYREAQHLAPDLPGLGANVDVLLAEKTAARQR
jgi:tetratricopeptide (TPR) repeat protein